MKYKKIYFAISGAFILLGIFSLFAWGLKLSVDFSGGTIIEYRFQNEISTKDVSEEIGNGGFEIISIQSTGEDKYLFKFPPMISEEKEEIASLLEGIVGEGELEELRFEIVGPSIGPELIKKTMYAIAIAAASILLWVAYQFKSFKFGVSAILAMLHDSFILVGLFALLGHFFNAEVDFLFVTALLTTLSFSAHDTIVVFDRIREIGGKNINDLEGVANQALTETMVRSLNNSFTIGFMLVALILLGGSTVKWFAIALFIGTVLGTYSSPFVAVPILVSWDGIINKFKFRK
ncbi:protein translocase subunit SecF [Patescibacteria group bacterium]|nr:protein translocase subunit SecF [Patescibacteria group bacterium]